MCILHQIYRKCLFNPVAIAFLEEIAIVRMYSHVACIECIFYFTSFSDSTKNLSKWKRTLNEYEQNVQSGVESFK